MLDLTEGHRGVRKQKLLCQSSHKGFDRFEMDLIWCETSWSDEAHTVFISSTRENYLGDFTEENLNMCLPLDIYEPFSFKPGIMINT